MQTDTFARASSVWALSTICPDAPKFDRVAVTIVTESLQNGQHSIDGELHAVWDDPHIPCWGSKPQLARSRVPRYTGNKQAKSFLLACFACTLVPLFRSKTMFVRRVHVASKRVVLLVVLVVQPPVEHGMVLAQSQQTLLMEMISVLQA